MAVAKNKRHKKSAVKPVYTATELYRGDSATSGYPHLAIQYQESTDVRVSILESKDVISFLVQRLRKGVSKNGIPWSRWEQWGQLTASTRAIGKQGANRLNLYGKHITGSPGRPSWYTFRNITTQPQVVSTIVTSPYLNAYNASLHTLYTRNIGMPSPELALENFAIFIEEKAVKQKTPQVIDEAWLIGEAPREDKDDPYPIASVAVKNNLVINLKSAMKAARYGALLAYPTFSQMLHVQGGGNVKFDSIPSAVSALLRSEDVASFAIKAFGKKNYRKDLVKAISSNSIDNLAPLAISMSLKNLVPIDWLITLLRKNAYDADPTAFRVHPAPPSKAVLADVRLLFTSLTLTQRRRLLKEDGWIGRYVFNDTIRMVRTLKREYGQTFAPGEIMGKNWREVHDFLSSSVTKQRQPKQKIEKVPLAKKIETISYDTGLSLLLPKTNYDLIDWGQNMGHCIGSYTYEAVSGDSVFLALMKDNKMIGNAQIKVSNNSLMQVFGYQNSRLDKDVLEDFSSKLIAEKIVTKESLERASGYAQW